MRNLGLAAPRFRDPVEVVRWLGAVQSQDFGPAKWSIAARIAGGATDAALDEAFNAGTILRTHVLRPTWHFAAAEDIRLLLQVTGPRVQARNRPRYRQLGLDESLLERATAIIAEAVAGAQHRTRRELGAVLGEQGIDTDGQRLAHVVMHAELQGVICSGALRGKQHTYALLDERAPARAPLSDDEALAELIQRYFTSHGPATSKDFSAWSSLTLTDITRGLHMAGTLESMEAEGRTLWFAGDPPAESTLRPAAHLLQMYDEYVMGYRETRGVINQSGLANVPWTRPTFNGMVVVDTQIVGEWRRTQRTAGMLVDVALRVPINKRQGRDIRNAAERYGAFLDQAVRVEIAGPDRSG